MVAYLTWAACNNHGPILAILDRKTSLLQKIIVCEICCDLFVDNIELPPKRYPRQLGYKKQGYPPLQP